MTVGILALQGSFAEHAAALDRIGVRRVLVRTPADMEGLDGLVIPGGESTTIGKLLVLSGLVEPLRGAVERGLPVYGTCAGMILLARDIGGLDQPLLGVMDITVRRNAFGRQLDSFEEPLEAPFLGSGRFRGVFIRAPLIERAGPDVTVLARLADGRAVAAQQGKILVSAFHPELTDDFRMHHYFLSLVAT
ncbi:MAG TPA: pyridoxal 5'-phosphate synthase glutaminase subunit PdxT [Spirochaetia bacterium]|nr:pyridoxal 5'-phosphate synthase glutaminase subunit PdxT [Spirochaetia bacterium]